MLLPKKKNKNNLERYGYMKIKHNDKDLYIQVFETKNNDTSDTNESGSDSD